MQNSRAKLRSQTDVFSALPTFLVQIEHESPAFIVRGAAYSFAFLQEKLREPVGALPLSADCRTGIGVIR